MTDAEGQEARPLIQDVQNEIQSVWRCAIGDVTISLDVLVNKWKGSRKKADRDAGATLANLVDLIWEARNPAPTGYNEATVAGGVLQKAVRTLLTEGEGK